MQKRIFILISATTLAISAAAQAGAIDLQAPAMRWLSIAVIASLTSISFAADIQPGNCARAAAYSEKNRGFSMLVMQNGKTVFDHYANGGGADRRCSCACATSRKSCSFESK